MGITLYTWPHSSGARAQWALEELGLPYETVVLDRGARQHQGAEYLAINPNGKVPALVEDDLPYFESAAILIHLGERHGVERGLWPAAGTRAHAEALSFTVWGVTELLRYTLEYLYHGADSPISYRAEDRSAAAAAYNRGELERMLVMLDRRLADREHLLGGFTLADIPAADALVLVKRFDGERLAGHPLVAGWLERCRSRPALGRVL